MYFPERRLRRPHRRADDRKIDLPAVHMARQRQRDPIGNPRKEIRLVNEQDRRGVIGDGAHRRREIVGAVTTARIGHTRQEVAEADQPEGASALGQSHRLIFEQRNARLRERPADAARIVRRLRWNGRRPPVVIAENCIDAERRLETGQLLGPGAGRHISGNEPMRAHIVAEQHREIGFLGIGEVDDVADALFRHPGIAGVDIGDDRDRELKILGPVGEPRRIFGERERRTGLDTPSRNRIATASRRRRRRRRETGASSGEPSVALASVARSPAVFYASVWAFASARAGGRR